MRTTVALRGTSRPQSPEDFMKYRCLVTGPQGTRGAHRNKLNNRTRNEAQRPAFVPSTCRHAQVMSTTIPLHQIETIRATPGILASDRNCFFRQRSCTKLNASAVGIRLVACDTSNVAGMLISECHCVMCNGRRGQPRYLPSSRV